MERAIAMEMSIIVTLFPITLSLVYTDVQFEEFLVRNQHVPGMTLRRFRNKR